jgi:hypothetical protein
MELDKFGGSIREEINAGYASGRERVGPDLTTNGEIFPVLDLKAKLFPVFEPGSKSCVYIN